MSGQTKNSPVKTSNLPDKCLMTSSILQAWVIKTVHELKIGIISCILCSKWSHMILGKMRLK